MGICDRNFDLHKEFLDLEQVVGHGGTYTDLLEIKLVHIAEKIMAHLPTPHQLQQLSLKRHVILDKN